MITLMLLFLLLQVSGGTLAGRLVDYDSRKPIQGARIVLLKTAFKAITDKNGEFAISNIPPGSYQLEILDTSYPSGGPKTITVSKDSTTRADYSMMRSRVPGIQHLEADTSKSGSSRE